LRPDLRLGLVSQHPGILWPRSATVPMAKPRRGL